MPLIDFEKISKFSIALLLVSTTALAAQEKVEMEDSTLSKKLAIKTKSNIVYSDNFMTIAVKKDGSVWAWGKSKKGNPDSKKPFSPERISGLSNIRSVFFAYETALALDKNGHVWSWGSNSNGQLGYPTEYGKPSTPRMIEALNNVVEIFEYAGTSFFLLADGSIYGIGSNSSGILEENDRDENLALRKIQSIPPMKRLSVNRGIAVAIDHDGKVWTWGASGDLSGRPGATPSYEQSQSGAYRYSAEQYKKAYTPPGIVDLPGKAVDIATADAVVVLLEDGAVWSWGYARQGQIGRLTSKGNIDDPTPARIKGLSRIVEIAAGSESFTALTDTGDLIAWGACVDGPIPQAPLPPNQAREPVYIKKSLKVMGLTSGWGYLDNNGDWWSWGNNNYGTRGTGAAVGYNISEQDLTKEYFLTHEKADWNYFH
jgi:alpha-tubulin suppressor-like RCC1 family protein